MARIAGVDLPRDKRVEIGLTYIYGIGRSTAQAILAETAVDPDTRVNELSDAEVLQIRETIDRDSAETDGRSDSADPEDDDRTSSRDG